MKKFVIESYPLDKTDINYLFLLKNEIKRIEEIFISEIIEYHTKQPLLLSNINKIERKFNSEKNNLKYDLIYDNTSLGEMNFKENIKNNNFTLTFIYIAEESKTKLKCYIKQLKDKYQICLEKGHSEKINGTNYYKKLDDVIMEYDMNDFESALKFKNDFNN